MMIGIHLNAHVMGTFGSADLLSASEYYVVYRSLLNMWNVP
jgi:hypothetical protein